MYKQSPEREALGRKLLEMQMTGMRNQDIARREGLTEGAVSGLIRTARFKRPTEFNTVQLGTPLDLRGVFMVIGDIHVPTVDYEFACLVSRVAEKHGIKRLVIGGDVFNMDAFSSYDTVVAVPSWAQERDAARLLFKQWTQDFERIYIIMGNHDRRMQKWAAGNIGPDDIFGMVTSSDKLTISNFGHLTINTTGDYPWRVTHSHNYSVNQLTVAGEMANKFQSNIISHHEHHLAKGYDRWKRFIIVNNGGLFDESKLAFVKLDDNKMPGMVNGFTMLKNGVATVFGKYPFTDWGEYF